VGVVADPAEAAAIMTAYLDARQWRPDTVDAFGLVAVRDHRGNARVRHPYRIGGNVEWFQDRAVHPDVSPKWHSPEGHTQVCYALDLADTIAAARSVNYPRPVLFVAEGPADVVALWHAEPTTPAIGIPGTARAAKWAPALAGIAVLIVTDADNAGDRAAAELAEALHRVDSQAARIRPPDGMDVDEWRRSIGDDALRAALIDAAEGVDW
jgi:DNA primase